MNAGWVMVLEGIRMATKRTTYKPQRFWRRLRIRWMPWPLWDY